MVEDELEPREKVDMIIIDDWNVVEERLSGYWSKCILNTVKVVY